MPSFEVLIAAAPLGFPAGCRALNALYINSNDNDNSDNNNNNNNNNNSNNSSDQFSQLVASALAASGNIIDVSASPSHAMEYDALLYIYSSLRAASPAVADAAAAAAVLDMNTYLSKAVVERVTEAYERAKSGAAAVVVRLLIIYIRIYLFTYRTN